MARAWHLTRTEAEWLVELMEESDNFYYWNLAHELREIFGMRLDNSKWTEHEQRTGIPEGT